jgi:hypothetical protein
MIMSGTASTFDRFAETSARRVTFTAELETIPDHVRGAFVRNYADAERRYIIGAIDAATYAGIVGELIRDLRGVARSVAAVRRRGGVLPDWMTAAPVSTPVAVTDGRTRGTLRLGRR